jgi:N-acetylmuramoyl-L-alanine amidase
VTLDGDSLVVRFDADAVDLANPGAPLPGAAAQGLIQGARVLDAATLGFTTGPKFGGYRVSSQTSDTSMRQTIEITSAIPQALSEPPPDLNALTSAGSGWLRTIALDPGHGGDDEGAKGAGGVKEKDLTLAVAKKLKIALESKLGVRVLLTRDDDRNVAIDDRTAVANNGKADLFISLHANASWRPALSGASIAIALFPHQAEQAARTLQPELVPAVGGAPRDIEFVPWDVAQLPHLEQSAAFANALEDQLRDRVPLSMKTVDAAPLRVLEPANMAAVLVEMGYVTNAEQEKQLAGDAFQNALVQALVDGVMKYRDSLGGAR